MHVCVCALTSLCHGAHELRHHADLLCDLKHLRREKDRNKQGQHTNKQREKGTTKGATRRRGREGRLCMRVDLIRSHSLFSFVCRVPPVSRRRCRGCVGTSCSIDLSFSISFESPSSRPLILSFCSDDMMNIEGSGVE